MNQSKFSKPPMMTKKDKEIEKKLESFINLGNISSSSLEDKNNLPIKLKKEKVKPLYLRAPESLWEDIHEIMARTGLSMNAICLELIRPEVKRKLKELKD